MALMFRKGIDGDYPYLNRTTVACVRKSAHYDGTDTPVLREIVEAGVVMWDVTIACDDSDPATIVGYVIGRAPDTVIWLHVVPELRRKGLARKLLTVAKISAPAVKCAFLPTQLEGSQASVFDIARKHKMRLHFRPYMTLRPEYVA